MRNSFWRGQRVLLAALVVFTLWGCASKEQQKQPVSSQPAPASLVSAEQEEIDMAGMIPSDCEPLFQKSQEWEYKPGLAWQPQNPTQALEATRFFAHFDLVPKVSAKKFRVWLNESTISQPAQRLDKFAQIQVCDAFLVSTFVGALIQYRWDKESAPEAKKNLVTFLLNQVAITSPLLSLATTVQLMDRAYKQKIISIHSSAAFTRLHGQIKKEVAAQEAEISTKTTPEEQEKLIRSEFEKSAKFREELSRLLPLP